MKKYINEMGAEIVVVEENYTDCFENIYVTWKFSSNNESHCVLKESFETMIKMNNYKKIN